MDTTYQDKPLDGHGDAALGSSIGTLYEAAERVVRRHDVTLHEVDGLLRQATSTDRADVDGLLAHHVALDLWPALADDLEPLLHVLRNGDVSRRVVSARTACKSGGGNLDAPEMHGQQYASWIEGVCERARALYALLGLCTLYGRDEDALIEEMRQSVDGAPDRGEQDRKDRMKTARDLYQLRPKSILNHLQQVLKKQPPLEPAGALAGLQEERAIVERNEAHEAAAAQPAAGDQVDAQGGGVPPLPEQARRVLKVLQELPDGESLQAKLIADHISDQGGPSYGAESIRNNAIKKLRSAGYPVESVKGGGYYLKG